MIANFKTRNFKLNALLLYTLAAIMLFTIMASLPPFAGKAYAASDQVTLDVRDADIRDVLSALAINMGCTMIFDAKPVNVDFNVKNMPPAQALELLIEGKGLGSVQRGNLIVVGEPAKLQSNYFDQMILTRFDIHYVMAKQVKDLIDELAVPIKILTVDNNPNVIWAQGTAQSLQKVRETVNAVDLAENHRLALLDYRTITTNNITPTRAVEILARAGILIFRYVEYNNQLLVFEKELFPRWSEVESLIAQLDSASARKEKTFVYKLSNIAAKDAADRLKLYDFGIGNVVKTVSYNNNSFAKEILVICPPHVENLVRDALDSLDKPQTSTRVPICTQIGDNAYDSLYSMRGLLSEMTDVPKANMHISRNLSGDSKEPAYVLWAEAAPDKLKILIDLVDTMGVEPAPVSEND